MSAGFLSFSVQHAVCFDACCPVDAASFCQVSETEREDLEESEKVQHWVERLCQTRLEQISCVENESPEVQSSTVRSLIPDVWTVDLLKH